MAAAVQQGGMKLTDRDLEHQFAAAAAVLLHQLMDGLQPDVICLQETKVPDELVSGSDRRRRSALRMCSSAA